MKLMLLLAVLAVESAARPTVQRIGHRARLAPPRRMAALRGDELVKPLREQSEAEYQLFLSAQPRVLVEAAQRVHSAAATFGSVHELAAQDYTDRLLKHSSEPKQDLLDREYDLFGTCLVLSDCALADGCTVPADANPSKCDALLAAMNRLQRLVAQRQQPRSETDLGESVLGAVMSFFGARDALINQVGLWKALTAPMLCSALLTTSPLLSSISLLLTSPHLLLHLTSPQLSSPLLTAPHLSSPDPPPHLASSLSRSGGRGCATARMQVRSTPRRRSR